MTMTHRVRQTVSQGATHLKLIDLVVRDGGKTA